MGLRLDAEFAHQDNKIPLSDEKHNPSNRLKTLIDKKAFLPELVNYISESELASLGQLMLVDDLVSRLPQSSKSKNAQTIKLARQLLTQSEELHVFVRPSSHEDLSLFLFRMLDHCPKQKEELNRLLQMQHEKLKSATLLFFSEFISAIKHHFFVVLEAM